LEYRHRANLRHRGTAACEQSIPGLTDCYSRPVFSTNRIEHESDGVVLAKSAMAYPGAKAVPMDGSNHQQMRNDENTKKRLFELWNGEHGTFFFTKEKQ